MIETTGIVEPWLWATLTEDEVLSALVAGHFSATLSPDPLPDPYLTFLMQSTRDVVGMSGDTISTDNLYIVKAVARSSSWDEVEAIFSRAHALIHRPNAVMQSGSGSLTCVREQIVQYPEIDAGVQYRHLGGIYRIRASADD